MFKQYLIAIKYNTCFICITYSIDELSFFNFNMYRTIRFHWETNVVVGHLPLGVSHENKKLQDSCLLIEKHCIIGYITCFQFKIIYTLMSEYGS